jgi:hypothetical protein
MAEHSMGTLTTHFYKKLATTTEILDESGGEDVALQ